MLFTTNKYQKRLNSLKKDVERKFGHGKAALWKNRDFEDLSFEINKATRVLISAATLKRIFGKNKTAETYYPQESTIEALKQYSGLNKSKTRQNSFLYKIGAGVLLLSIIVGLLFILKLTKKRNNPDLISATISLEKIDGANPATAYFNLQVPESEDSVFISFGDEHPLVFVNSDNKVISHYYRHPGQFEVFLTTKDNTISDTLKLYIPTNDWQALAYYYQQDHTERYFPVPLDMVTNNNVFHPSEKNLASIGMDTTRIVVVRLDNFKRTGINGDNFQLKTRIKNVNFWPAIRCYSIFIEVLGSSGKIRFKLTNEGCSQFGQYTIGEKQAQGINADLTAFSLNIKEWNNFEIVNTDKMVSTIINSSEVFNTGYTKSIGEIIGVSLSFHGSGYVDFFEMYDKESNAIFIKNFLIANRD